jgi:hypothetical protein
MQTIATAEAVVLLRFNTHVDKLPRSSEGKQKPDDPKLADDR